MRIFWFVCLLGGLLLSKACFAQFDFCSNTLSGSFQFGPINQNDAITVGEIPIGIDGLRLTMLSVSDMDFQLYDSISNTQIIQWPHGLLNGAFNEGLTYVGLQFDYSGYNGTCVKDNPPPDCQTGNEYITITGATNRPLTLKVFAYQAGNGVIQYSWTNSQVQECSTPAQPAIAPQQPEDKVYTNFNGVWNAERLGQVITLFDDTDTQLVLTVLSANQTYASFAGTMTETCVMSPCFLELTGELTPQFPSNVSGEMRLQLESPLRGTLTGCTSLYGCLDQPVTLTRSF